MTVRYTSDKQGPKAGVDYDALQTVLDGKGKWWDGMDHPVDLYGPKHAIDDSLHSPYANQFMWRVDDAVTKYHPDVIYFDEHAGDSQVDLGIRMGLGYLAPTPIANYYNKSMSWNQGKMASRALVGHTTVFRKANSGRWADSRDRGSVHGGCAPPPTVGLRSERPHFRSTYNQHHQSRPGTSRCGCDSRQVGRVESFKERTRCFPFTQIARCRLR